MTADQVNDLLTNGGAYGVIIVVGVAVLRGYLRLEREVTAIEAQNKMLREELEALKNESRALTQEQRTIAQLEREELRKTIDEQATTIERLVGLASAGKEG